MAFVIVAAILAGCGGFNPFATPMVPRPPLPPVEPFPSPTVEEAVEWFDSNGIDCGFSPASDVPEGWQCSNFPDHRPGTISIGIDAGVVGAISRIWAYLDLEGEPTALDQEAHVRTNRPVVIGEGWVLSFDRNSISRTMRIQYSEGAG